MTPTLGIRYSECTTRTRTGEGYQRAKHYAHSTLKTVAECCSISAHLIQHTALTFTCSFCFKQWQLNRDSDDKLGWFEI